MNQTFKVNDEFEVFADKLNAEQSRLSNMMKLQITEGF